jgi:RHS repeat-associated protein
MIYANQKIGYVAGTQAAAATFTLSDQVGSEVATISSAGTVLSTLDYTPFGQLTSGTSSDGFIFTGLQRDGSGLDHAMFRQYASTTGRWTVPDPYDGSYSLSNPQSMNR